MWHKPSQKELVIEHLIEWYTYYEKLIVNLSATHFMWNHNIIIVFICNISMHHKKSSRIVITGNSFSWGYIELMSTNMLKI